MNLLKRQITWQQISEVLNICLWRRICLYGGDGCLQCNPTLSLPPCLPDTHETSFLLCHSRYTFITPLKLYKSLILIFLWWPYIVLVRCEIGMDLNPYPKTAKIVRFVNNRCLLREMFLSMTLTSIIAPFVGLGSDGELQQQTESILYNAINNHAP